MGWRERLFGSKISFQICTVAKSGSFVRKQKSAQNPSNGNSTENFRSPITSTSSSTAADETSTIVVPSTALLSAATAAAVATYSPPPAVIGISAAFAVECAHPPSPTKNRQCSSSGVQEDAMSITSVLNSAPICRICQDKRDEEGSDTLISPCGCAGSTKYVHQTCLNKWTKVKGSSFCEICQLPYNRQYVKIPCCAESNVDSMFVTAITIILFLLGVTGLGAYIMVEHVKRVTSSNTDDETGVDNENDGLKSGLASDIWMSVTLLVSGLLGIILFLPYLMYFCIVLCQIRARRQGRVAPQQIQV